MSVFTRISLYFSLVFTFCSCSWLGMENTYKYDPVTGGENASYSILLKIRLPAGLQRYASHGYTIAGANGKDEGMETYRGDISPTMASVDLFNEMRKNGWNLRLSLRKGDRSVALYQKDDELAILTLRKQGMLTILEIWAGSRLQDGATLSFESQKRDYVEDEPYVELPGEEYGPLDEQKTAPKKVEKWGSTLEEREL